MAVVGGEFPDIIRLPGQARRQIGQLQFLGAGQAIVQLHDQGRAVAQVGRQFPKDDAARLTGLDAVTDAQHGPLGGGEHGGLLLGLLAGGGVDLDDPDGAADVLLQQLARGEQIKVEILLDDLEFGAFGQAPQQGRLRLDAGADIAKGQIQPPDR